MIAYLEGLVVHKEASFVILDLQGVGYQVRIALPTYAALEVGKKFKLHTFMQVREDAHTLFGFKELAEKKIFLDLTSVSGIGANTALVILSSLSITEIKNAIASENVSTIQGIKGIGLKTAQRIILELKDKILKENVDIGTTSPANIGSLVRAEALQALIALGISKLVAEKNLEAIAKKHGTDLGVEDLIRYALKM